MIIKINDWLFVEKQNINLVDPKDNHYYHCSICGHFGLKTNNRQTRCTDHIVHLVCLTCSNKIKISGKHVPDFINKFSKEQYFCCRKCKESYQKQEHIIFKTKTDEAYGYSESYITHIKSTCSICGVTKIQDSKFCRALKRIRENKEFICIDCIRIQNGFKTGHDNIIKYNKSDKHKKMMYENNPYGNWIRTTEKGKEHHLKHNQSEQMRQQAIKQGKIQFQKNLQDNLKPGICKKCGEFSKIRNSFGICSNCIKILINKNSLQYIRDENNKITHILIFPNNPLYEKYKKEYIPINEFLEVSENTEFYGIPGEMSTRKIEKALIAKKKGKEVNEIGRLEYNHHLQVPLDEYLENSRIILDQTAMKVFEDLGFEKILTGMTGQGSDGKSILDDLLVKANIAWFVYIVGYIKDKKVHPLKICKSGSLLVNYSGCDVCFWKKDNPDNDDKPSVLFLRKTNSEYYYQEIWIKKCKTEEEAYEEEIKLQKQFPECFE